MAHEYFKVGTTQALINNIKSRIAGKADPTALAPLLTTGATLGITGDGPTDSATWLQRTSAGDGPTTVKSIHGRTLAWNQHAPAYDSNLWVVGGKASISTEGTALKLTNRDAAGSQCRAKATNFTIPSNHYIYIAGTIDASHIASGVTALRLYASGGSGADVGSSGISVAAGTGKARYSFITATSAEGASLACAIPSTGEVGTDYALFSDMLCIDLTAMFGAGNEPSTVAELEALYPEPYYPYDAGSLLPVNMTGIETVGANLWGGDAMHDDVQSAVIDTASSENAYGRYIMFSAPRVSNKVLFAGPFKPDTRYTLILSAGKNNTSDNLNMRVYYTDGTYSNVVRTATDNDGTPQTVVLVSTAGKTVDRVQGVNSSGNTYLYYDGSGVFEGVHTADEFEPYWQQERTIDAAAYFPDGMRGVGSDYDELTKTAAITRIGERAYQSGDESDATVVTDGTVTHYVLSTPTTVEIDPPLNLTYRTEQGGTERVMVPTGEQSAPPTIVAAHGYTAESLRDAALATIAPVENGKASTNYGVGSYLVHGGQLCKVTTAIASGEAIAIGTNVTATTVMAEVIALIAQ